MRTQPRFPEVPREAGHYESLYIKASDPQGGRAIWIRHTVHKRPGAEPTCAVWMTYFDRSADSPRAAKQQYGLGELSVPGDSYLRVNGSEIGPGKLSGALSADGVDATWGLRFSDRHDSFRHLPSEWMYRARLPRTKLLSPHPGALFDGTFEIDGERIEVSAWPGMVGHNWGAEHAERWVWIHGTGPEGGEETDFLDIAAGQIRIGPWTTPWIANGALTLDGELHRLGGLGSALRTKIEATPTGCRFIVPGRGVTLRGTVEAPREQFVAWLYSDPAGGEHHALNCSVSDLEAEVESRRIGTRRLSLQAAAAYELGSHETGHGVPLQPFEDG